jgi:glycosyltransferase involved in cell wall biosynthesis
MRPVLIGSEPTDYTIAFANGLASHVPTTIVLPKSRFETLLPWFDAALDGRLIDWPRHRSLRNPDFLMRLNALLRELQPEILHLLSNTTLWLNLAAPFWRPTPLVTTIHDVVRHPGDRDTATLPPWCGKLIARQSRDVVVHGAGLKTAAVREFGKDASRVHVLQHPAITRYADLARQMNLTRSREARGFNILMFGRIYRYKGLDTLIEAESLLGHEVPDLRIVIAGRGDDPWDLRDRMGEPGRYEILSRFIEDAEVAQLFVDCDLVVLPYSEASQSGVIHVAATFGKPVLVSDVGELRPTVEGNGLGMVVPPRDAPALARAIVAMARDDALRRATGQRSLEWSRGANAPASIGAEALDIYSRILRRT